MLIVLAIVGVWLFYSNISLQDNTPSMYLKCITRVCDRNGPRINASSFFFRGQEPRKAWTLVLGGSKGWVPQESPRSLIVCMYLHNYGTPLVIQIHSINICCIQTSFEYKENNSMATITPSLFYCTKCISKHSLRKDMSHTKNDVEMGWGYLWNLVH